jgi:hypothetical protein
MSDNKGQLCCRAPPRTYGGRSGTTDPRGREVPKNSCSQQIDRRIYMSKFNDQLEIRILRGYMELRFNGWEYKLGLDKRGLPQFPKWVQKELPRYIPKLLREMNSQMRVDCEREAQNLEVLHEYNCPHLASVGSCNCDPVLCRSDLAQVLVTGGTNPSQILTCTGCNESSIGRPLDEIIVYNGDLIRKIWQTWDGDKTYTVFSPRTLLCEKCLPKVLRGYDPSADDSLPDRAQRPPLKVIPGGKINVNRPKKGIRENREADGMVADQGVTEGQAGPPPLPRLKDAGDNLQIDSQTAQ